VFATGPRAGFPKSVTVDLGRVRQASVFRLGTPGFGSTGKVRLAVAEKADAFAPVAEHEFAAGVPQRVVIRTGARPVRFVRVEFLGNHAARHEYDPNWCFLSELEVFESR
jgi:hypothetical protein